MDKKRLTIEEMGEQIRCYVPYGECNDCDKCDHADKIRRKLAAYERACDDPINVAVWAKAEAEGRLAVLPYAIGDTVYWPSMFGGGVLSGVIERILIEPTGLALYINRSFDGRSACKEASDVFNHRADAEAALAAEGGRYERLD